MVASGTRYGLPLRAYGTLWSSKSHGFPWSKAVDSKKITSHLVWGPLPLRILRQSRKRQCSMLAPGSWRHVMQKTVLRIRHQTWISNLTNVRTEKTKKHLIVGSPTAMAWAQPTTIEARKIQKSSFGQMMFVKARVLVIGEFGKYKTTFDLL